MKERGAKVLKEKKKQKKKGQDDKKDKPKGLYTRESEAQLMLQAMAFNENVIHLHTIHCSVIIGRNPIEANATSSVISTTWKCISPYLKIL